MILQQYSTLVVECDLCHRIQEIIGANSLQCNDEMRRYFNESLEGFTKCSDTVACQGRRNQYKYYVDLSTEETDRTVVLHVEFPKHKEIL